MDIINNLRIGHLADHPEAVPVLKEWFETEWADYYGPTGPGDAEWDLIAYSSREKLPVGLVAFCEDRLGGIAALKLDPRGTPQKRPYGDGAKPAIGRVPKPRVLYRSHGSRRKAGGERER